MEEEEDEEDLLAFSHLWHDYAHQLHDPQEHEEQHSYIPSILEAWAKATTTRQERLVKMMIAAGGEEGGGHGDKLSIILHLLSSFCDLPAMMKFGRAPEVSGGGVDVKLV